jgi:hypothetical protein
MALGRDYDKACPIFNFSTRDAGVIFPVTLTDFNSTGAQALDYVNLDGADTSTVLFRFKLPMKMRLITCQAYAIADDGGAKSGAATTEPIIGISYGTAPLGSAADTGTSLALITCSGAGAYGVVWVPGGGTTQVTLEAGQEIVAYLNTAAAGDSTSTLYDGGAKVVLWFAQANSPA